MKMMDPWMASFPPEESPPMISSTDDEEYDSDSVRTSSTKPTLLRSHHDYEAIDLTRPCSHEDSGPEDGKACSLPARTSTFASSFPKSDPNVSFDYRNMTEPEALPPPCHFASKLRRPTLKSHKSDPNIRLYYIPEDIQIHAPLRQSSYYSSFHQEHKGLKVFRQEKRRRTKMPTSICIVDRKGSRRDGGPVTII
jgi:hypothetical protein